MKRVVFGFTFLLILTLAIGAAPVFAQGQEASEQERIQELQAVVLQLFKLVAELQQQIFNIQAARISGVPAVATSILSCGQAEVTWEKVSGATGYVLYRNDSEGRMLGI